MQQAITDNYANATAPSQALLKDISKIQGDIMILGAGGKMGPSLSILAKKAILRAGIAKEVFAVSRFSDSAVKNQLYNQGIKIIEADLLIDEDLASLPECANILYLAGTKFGTKGNESFTWAMNSYLPGRVAQKFKNSNIVVFSTGNVYHLSPVFGGGSTEESIPSPVGEYAQSCLGRERLFQYYSVVNKTPMLLYRLNYANDVSYGILLEIAKSVSASEPISLNMGNVNVIWQGDANEIAIRALLHCSNPPKVLNITGPETISIRWLAEEFGKIMNIKPLFTGDEQTTALLSNAAQAFELFGYPKTTLKEMIKLIASWWQQGGKIANKDTHFQEREGKY